MSGGGTAGRPRLSTPARTRLGLALIALLVAFAVLAVAVGAHATSHLDARAIAWMSGHRTDGAVAAAKVLGAVGAWYITAPLVVAAAVLLVALRRRRDALYLVITVATAAGLNVCLASQ